ncbi:unnamed protein product [Bubo scandiacus]
MAAPLCSYSVFRYCAELMCMDEDGKISLALPRRGCPRETTLRSSIIYIFVSYKPGIWDSVAIAIHLGLNG